MAEIHEIYTPTASATNVLNQNGGIKGPGQNAETGIVPSDVINSPDDTIGTSTVVIPNESSPIVLSSTVIDYQPYNEFTLKTVNGRFDLFNVINNGTTAIVPPSGGQFYEVNLNGNFEQIVTVNGSPA